MFNNIVAARGRDLYNSPISDDACPDAIGKKADAVSGSLDRGHETVYY